MPEPEFITCNLKNLYLSMIHEDFRQERLTTGTEERKESWTI